MAKSAKTRVLKVRKQTAIQDWTTRQRAYLQIAPQILTLHLGRTSICEMPQQKGGLDEKEIIKIQKVLSFPDGGEIKKKEKEQG